jgi:hypothetical protein
MHEFDYGIVEHILDDSDEDLRQVRIQYGQAIYVEVRTLFIVSLPAPRVTSGVVDGHRFDADPDLNFYFAADPDPDWHLNYANLRVEPIVVLAVFEKIELTVFSLHFEMGTYNYFVEFYIKMMLHTSNLKFF